MNRVAITGMGLVTSLGTDYNDVFAKVCNGQSGISHVDFEEKTAATIGGKIDETFDPKKYISPVLLRTLDPYTVYGLYAAYKAVEDAQLTDFDPTRCSVVVGSGIGGLNEIYTNMQKAFTHGIKRVSPFFIPKILSNMLAGHIANTFKVYGPSNAVVSACATGSHAIGTAMRMIQYGDADIVICGGSEAALHPIGLAGFSAAGALSTQFNDQPTKASRPWDKKRDGFVMSDGAAILVLERPEHAHKRNARIHGFIEGYGASSDAHHITTPPPDGYGAQLAMNKALQDAGLSPNQISYINAHATSTPLGDEAEIRAIKHVFKEHTDSLKVSSTKSCTGHLLGAAGSLEAIFSILSLQNNIVPPTINLEDPDIPDNIQIDLVPHTAQKIDLSYVMSNSFGFGGTNASLIFSKSH